MPHELFLCLITTISGVAHYIDHNNYFILILYDLARSLARPRHVSKTEIKRGLVFTK